MQQRRYVPLDIDLEITATLARTDAHADHRGANAA
jgi:hypothetical protein